MNDKIELTVFEVALILPIVEAELDKWKKLHAEKPNVMTGSGIDLVEPIVLKMSALKQEAVQRINDARKK